MSEFLLKPEVIKSNYKEFYRRINDLFPTRNIELKKMYDLIGEDRLMFAPASGQKKFHNCFPGGYIDHVLRVMDFAELNYERYKQMDLYLDNFTIEELLFAALNHDLGKLGFIGEGYDYYLPQTDKWRLQNLDEAYVKNGNIPYATVPDIGLFMLQQNNIKLSWNEYQAIKLHDGLYEDANKNYYINYTVTGKFRCNIIQLLHEADFGAFRFEFERWNKESNKLSMNRIDGKIVNTNDIQPIPEKKNDLLAEFDNFFKK